MPLILSSQNQAQINNNLANKNVESKWNTDLEQEFGSREIDKTRTCLGLWIRFEHGGEMAWHLAG